eukprot:TRINITY_DN9867_c0_g1_i7.p1 TRINITY_DN9867_c0_g1~~TRINITY_DN9867_c0_g1_i7.p1  ORF type:complete len:195 (-),score=33.96 TRINITY_DN9867_c0_g1_i7:2164-2748(-)
MNLTAVTEASEVMKRHVEDSLAIIPPIQSHYLSRCDSTCDRLNLVDVGSGAGLPGLIFAIACPGWKVTLLESMQKRCMFLEHAVGLIGLSNVEILCARAENVGQNLDSREMFDVAVARAVAEMRVLAEYCLPLVRVGGLFVAAKGYDPQVFLSLPFLILSFFIFILWILCFSLKRFSMIEIISWNYMEQKTAKN